ncbi:MAG: GGDEF domain-containing response regulator [Gammaproteobacteria bacterium]|nr:GGDEF domain-containing response regulator [Gammaproteobacteria bacterium]
MATSKSTNTVRLLILHDSKDEAELLISELRNFGYVTRAHLIEDEVDLLDALGVGAWDILLARPTTDDIGAYAAIKHIQAKDKDIPTIILSDDGDGETITEGLKNGARDVVPVTELERLKIVFQRELTSSNERKTRRLAEIRLREVEKRCALLLHSSRDAISYVHEGMHIYANDAYIELFGHNDVDDLEGMPIMDMIAPQDKEEFKQFLRDYQKNQEKTDLTCYTLHVDGSEIKSQMFFSDALYDGEPCIQIVLRVDVGDAELEEKLREISSQDLLTGLGNKEFFIEKLDQCISNNTEKHQTSSLLYISPAHFGDLKSSLGIGNTDLLLAGLATLIRGLLDENETLSRFSEDVFTVILPCDEEEATSKSLLIVKTISEHIFEVGSETQQLTVRVGVAIINENCPLGNELISCAHGAMEEAGNEGGNGVSVFKPQEVIVESEVVSIAEQVKRCLDEEKLVLLYQPIINLRGESTELYEVLIRMRDHNEELVTAGQLLGEAEKAGMGGKIDRWVVLQAIKELSKQHEEGKSTRLFINLTRASIEDKTFLPWLSVAFKASRLPADSIIWQMTENVISSTLKEAKQFTKSLEEIHCQVSISRFGCALNPFNALKHLNVTYLKLEPSFIEELSNEENKEALKELITTSHAQGKLVIIPFVENAAILSTLWQIGTNFVQGHYLQPPMNKMNYDFSEDE